MYPGCPLVLLQTYLARMPKQAVALRLAGIAWPLICVACLFGQKQKPQKNGKWLP